ncbi:ubiquitin carboxyl-terminal hydrolase [Allofrancisella frigidaquae]|uniref:USP domain-containing protein n=1 Tax=Allofrancisella frigidaquae TaxID=1085644 RepID=A0A6M3HZ70_9GAMM|nr:ubiquitin carboxyl-terminal hydrolase family protein [Allofrancisella frigidaquae]QIV94976.1 hypothetical protein E3E15_06300 [Allofrancisella frigidaquae]
MIEYKKYYAEYKNLNVIDIEQIKKELDENFKIEPGYKATFAIGDLHGNALKAIRFLIEIGVIDLQQHNLQSIYDSLKSAYYSKNYLTFQTHLNKIRFDASRIKQVKLVFIGAILADRGNSDYMTLLVFGKMKESRIDYTICLSNHDEKFIDLLKGCIKPRSIPKSYDLDSIPQSEQYEDTFLENYATAYLPHLKVMEYETIGDNEIVYSHAPCNFEAIRKIKFAPTNKKLSGTIIGINNYFQDFVINSNQSFTSKWIMVTRLHNFVCCSLTNTKFVNPKIINVFGHIDDKDTNNQNQVNLYSNFGKDNDPPTGDLKIYSVYKYQTSENFTNYDFSNEEMNELFEEHLELRDKSIDSSKTSFKAESSDQNYVTCKKRNSAKDIRETKDTKTNILKILEGYLKTNPNNTSKSRNIWLYLKGRNHINRLKKVYEEIERSTNINDMQSILQQQKDIFESAMSYSKTKVKGSISERWNKNEYSTIKNIPKDLNKSEFYKTINSALNYVNTKLQKASGPRYNSSQVSFNHLASHHFNRKSNFFTPLHNVYNTCYINSSLQLLDHINESADNIFNFPSFSSRKSLSALVSDFWCPEDQTLNENYSQQDAAAFLQCLIESNKYRDSLLPRFQISYEVQKKITSCWKHATALQYCRNDDSNMLEISLNKEEIQKQYNPSLKKLIEKAQLEESPLDNPVCYACMSTAGDDNYSIENEKKYRCAKGVEIRKLVSTSSYLIIHLKRFGYNENTGAYKINDSIDIENELTIQNHNRYKLVAYIIHEGNQLTSGHYYLVSLKNYPNMYKINDEKVIILNENKEIGLRKHAYIMLYKKI